MRLTGRPALRGDAGLEPSAPGRTGVVFDVQRYSLDDGPGIRTTVFLKGCPLRCAWCQNPESLRRGPSIAFRAERCLEDGACQRTCPRAAIAPGRGFRIVPDRCDGCAACVEACPSMALTLVGRRMTVAELLAVVLRDAPFHAASGGGVTVSGGEPTMQRDFLAAFLAACNREGVHTALETSGFSGRAALSRLLPSLDRIYLDLKVISPGEHRRLTGVDNRRILANARWLARSGAPVTFRMPLVPGMTMTDRNVEETAAFLTTLGVRDLELCPYHDGWRPKLAWLGPDQDRPELSPPSPGAVQRVVAAFAASRITARAGPGSLAPVRAPEREAAD